MIYFDNAATYVVNRQEITDYFCKMQKEFFANTNSPHRLGYLANRKLIEAQNEVLKIFDLSSDQYEVIFNSGSSEGISHALKGYAHLNKSRGNEIIVFKNEHLAVLNTIKSLEDEGFIIHYINSDKYGEIIYDEIKKALNSHTIMVVVMSVNNEVGSINDLNKIRYLINNYPKCVLFSDTTQSVGKLKINYSLLDMFVCSAHKFGGFIGSGILIKKKKIRLKKLIDGGNHQNNERSGTVALPLILSTVYFLKQACININQHWDYVKSLSQHLIDLIKLLGDEININSNSKFPYIVSLSLKHHKASVVVEALSLKEIYVSSQSACRSKDDTPSYVILNMGLSHQLADNVLRISFSHENTLDEVDTFVKTLKDILGEIK